MILTIDSDAAYLVAPKARSRAAGYFYLGNNDGKLFNGPIFILTKLIQAVMASAAEAECAGLYLNAHESVPMPAQPSSNWATLNQTPEHHSALTTAPRHALSTKQ